jgi:hypothetical protein
MIIRTLGNKKHGQDTFLPFRNRCPLRAPTSAAAWLSSPPLRSLIVNPASSLHASVSL